MIKSSHITKYNARTNRNNKEACMRRKLLIFILSLAKCDISMLRLDVLNNMLIPNDTASLELCDALKIVIE